MVRIPSRLIDSAQDSPQTFGTGSRGLGGASGYRQLLRLVLALILVGVVMQSAGNKRIYEPFFGDPMDAPVTGSRVAGTPVAGTSVNRQAAGESGGVAGSASESGAAMISEEAAGPDAAKHASGLHPALPAECQTGLTRLRAATLMKWLAATEPPFETADEDAWRDEIRLSRDDAAAASKSVTVDSDSWINSLQDWLRESEASKPVLHDFLLGEAMRRVVDGSVFQSGDAPLFYWLLSHPDITTVRAEETPDVSKPSAPQVATLLLLQQPEVYRGTRIRVAGTVARIDRMDVAPNPLVNGSWYRVWVRPRDGVDRPIVLATQSIPNRLSEIEGLGNLSNGAEIDVEGIYIKRLSYRSGVGADLAPLVVGRLDRVGVETGDADGEEPMDASEWGVLAWALPIAGLIGVGFAFLLMQRARAGERHLRHLRDRAPVDISHLGELENENTSGQEVPGDATGDS